jgi:hypothetical protein
VDPAGWFGTDALRRLQHIALAVIAKARIVCGLEETMHQAANVPFERAVEEFVRWRAVPEQARSPAPAWWWGPAFELRGVQQPMPAEWCASLGLPDSATYADGAAVFLNSLAGQTSLPWPDDFPGKAAHSNSA